MAYERKKDGLYHDPKTGRTWQHEGYATRIYWSTAMLDYLRRHFPTTLNEELAGCLGVSPRTMIRKARQLGLEKDPVWLRQIWDERRRMAHAIANRKGNPGSFQKGHRYNPNGEFKKGHRLSDEARQKQAASIKRWYRLHPIEAKAKAAKIWATRRANKSSQSAQSIPPHPCPHSAERNHYLCQSEGQRGADGEAGFSAPNRPRSQAPIRPDGKHTISGAVEYAISGEAGHSISDGRPTEGAAAGATEREV